MPVLSKERGIIWFGILILACAIWVYITTMWAFRFDVLDDSYITFRYAKHLMEGHGLVWNAGEAPTEGFTNLLLVVLLAPAYALKWDLLLVTRTLSILSALGVGILLLWGARRFWGVPVLLGLAGVVAWFTFDPTAIHSMYGLETLLFTFLLTVLATLTLAHIERAKTSTLPAILLSGSLLLLTRPEGIAFTALSLGWIGLRRARRTRAWWGALAAFALIIGAWFGLRYLYFGNWLPLTYLIKTEALETPLPGLFVGVRFAADILVLLALGVLALRPMNERAGYLAVMAGFALGFYLFVRPEQAMYHRFLFPTFPLWILLAIRGTQNILAAFPPRLASRSSLVYASLLVTMLVVQPHQLIYTTPRSARVARLAFQSDNRGGIIGMVQFNTRLGEALMKLHAGSALSCVNEDAGVTTYLSDCRHLDPVGLTSAAVARADTRAAYTDALLGQEPDVMFLRTRTPTLEIETEMTCPGISHGKHARFGRAAIYTDERFNEYEVIGSAPEQSGRFYQFILRRDSPHYPALRSLLIEFIQQEGGYLVGTPAPVITQVQRCPDASI